MLAVTVLRTLIWSLRLLGNMARFTGRMLISIYDLLIFAPLWVEQLVKTSAEKKEVAANEAAEPESTSSFVRESM